MRTCEPVMRTPAATAVWSDPVEARIEATSKAGGDCANAGAANARQQTTLSRRDIPVTSNDQQFDEYRSAIVQRGGNRAALTTADGGRGYRVSDVEGRQARVIRTEHSGREST